MTVTAPQPRTDAKAGYCVRCRNGSHVLCASQPDRCGCPYGEHPNRPEPSPAAAAPDPEDSERPGPAAQAHTCGYCRNRNHRACRSTTCSCSTGQHPNRHTGSTPATPKPQGRSEPVWELSREDPPAPPPKPKKLTPAELAQPLLDAIVATSRATGTRDSYRIALFASTYAAGQIRKRLEAAFSAEVWEFSSTRDRKGRPAIFARWIEPKGDEG